MLLTFATCLEHLDTRDMLGASNWSNDLSHLGVLPQDLSAEADA